MLHGELPTRDFVDFGAPLSYVPTAAAMWAAGGTLLGHVLLSVLMLATGAALTYYIGWRASGSHLVGLVVALVQLALGPRFYSYPKIVLYALAVLGWWAYARKPTPPTLAALARADGDRVSLPPRSRGLHRRRHRRASGRVVTRRRVLAHRQGRCPLRRSRGSVSRTVSRLSPDERRRPRARAGGAGDQPHRSRPHPAAAAVFHVRPGATADRGRRHGAAAASTDQGAVAAAGAARRERDVRGHLQGPATRVVQR